MGGGLMQLVAYGAQDIYLTGNPQITFFKVVYRRHTNFSMESIKQTFNGSVSAGSRLSSTISRNGDLIGATHVELINCTWNEKCHNPGAHAIDTVECEIGGQLIDRQYGHWMETWTELTQPGLGNLTVGVNISTNKKGGATNNTGTDVGATHDISTHEIFNIGRCVKDISPTPGDAVSVGGNQHIVGGNRFQSSTGMGGVYCGNTSTGTTLTNVVPLMVPLYFWFCRNPGLALPLIALQYHEVKIILELTKSDVSPDGWTGPGASGEVNLWVDYIYLDTDERRRFAQVSHEYLIEQLQYQTLDGKTKGSYNLNFNHPVKELIWTGAWSINGTFESASGGLGNVTSGAPHQVKWGLKLNGHDRFEPRTHNYFSKTQVLQHHSGWGMVPNDPNGLTSDEICVYSFALKPEEHQPSGSCNFSRIDSARLEILDKDAGSIPNVYAVNYNVLRIMSGMGGLAYSN